MSREEHLAWNYGNIRKISLYFPSFIKILYPQMKKQLRIEEKINFKLRAVSILFLSLYSCTLGHAVAPLVGALRFKPEGHVFDPRW